MQKCDPKFHATLTMCPVCSEHQEKLFLVFENSYKNFSLCLSIVINKFVAGLQLGCIRIDTVSYFVPTTSCIGQGVTRLELCQLKQDSVSRWLQNPDKI